MKLGPEHRIPASLPDQHSCSHLEEYSLFTDPQTLSYFALLSYRAECEAFPPPIVGIVKSKVHYVEDGEDRVSIEESLHGSVRGTKLMYADSIDEALRDGALLVYRGVKLKG